MKTKQTSTHKGAFTLIELLVVISIIAIIASLAMPAFSSFMQKGRMTEQMSNGLNIFKSMASYRTESGHDGNLPLYSDTDDPSTLVASTNDALEILLRGNYIDDKRIFANKASAWCKAVTNDDTTAKKVQVGETDWCYVRGLRDTSNSRWPVLANAFAAEGDTTYVTDPGKRGGVWKGSKAVVIYVGGNGEVVETKAQGASTGSGAKYFVKRSDKPTADAFVPEGDWLSGDNIKVLYPKP